MKKMRLTALILALSLLFGQTVHARATDSAEVVEKAQLYSAEFYEVMLMLLDEYVGRELTPQLLYEAALNGIAGELDKYSVYMSEVEFDNFINSLSGHFEGIGIQIGTLSDGTIAIVNVIPDSPAEGAGVQKGDVILAINGEDTAGMNGEDIVELISISPTTVELKLQRADTVLILAMEKADIKLNTVQVVKFADIFTFANESSDSIRYVALNSFSAESTDDFSKALISLSNDGIRDIVLDLRGNGGGYLDQVENISRMILPEGPIYYDVDATGAKRVHNSWNAQPPLDNIVILTDNGTASAAELLAAALQDSGIATVVGETTYGKGVIQTAAGISTGGAFKFTYSEYLRRSGEKLNKIGVIPDVPVVLPGLLSAMSPDIVMLKSILSFLEYGPPNDSPEFGLETQNQLKALQRDLELEPTGILDENTVQAINQYLYTIYSETDPVLEAGYNILMEKMQTKDVKAGVTSEMQ